MDDKYFIMCIDMITSKLGVGKPQLIDSAGQFVVIVMLIIVFYKMVHEPPTTQPQIIYQQLPQGTEHFNRKTKYLSYMGEWQY